MTVAAAVLAGLAVLVVLGRPPDGRLRRTVGPAAASGGAAQPRADALADGRAGRSEASASAVPRRIRGAPTRSGWRPSAGPPSTRRATARLSPATAACLLAGVAVVLVVASPLGLVLGAVVGAAGPRLLTRLEPRAAREERMRLLADLPLVLDLLASCLAGGAPLPDAAREVARAVPGPAGGRLAGVAAALAVGSPPRDAWRALAGSVDDDPLAPAARALARAADGGAPVAAAVSRLAADARADARSRGEQAARRVGVLAVAPLGLCFLPAFVLLGVVPVVVGLAGPLLASF